MLVAAHQPNFLPWLGFFAKLAKADRMVLLDEVQYPRTNTGTPTNRVRFVIGGAPAWVTVPIVREGVQAIGEVRVDDRQPWRRKSLKSIEFNYAKSPGFEAVIPIVREVLARETDRLADLNEHGIRLLAPAHAHKLVRQSALGETADAAGTDLLIALTRAAGGDAYLSGDGADGYQDEPRYAAAGLGFQLLGFEHPETGGPDGLSIVDALMRGYRAP